MGIIENIILGAIGSLVATIILFLLSQLYKIGYKKDFEFSLEMAYTAIYQIENLHKYPNDYTLVISQIDCLYENAFKMYRYLSPLSLWAKPKSKKLIITLLNDIISACEVSKFTTVGFTGEDEWEARLKRIERIFYKYKYLDDYNCSTVRVQLDIIGNLIKKKSISDSIKDAFGRIANNIPLEDLVIDGFINVNSLKQEKHNIGLRNYCFVKKDLEKLFREEFKGKI